MIRSMLYRHALASLRQLIPASENQSQPDSEQSSITHQRGSRREALLFERDYPTFLLSLASSVRAGLDPLAAILTTRDIFPQSSPIHQEIARTEALIREGEPELDALERFAEMIAHPDLPLFRSTLTIAIREGGPIGPSLERLARVTRRRQAFRQRARGAVAMQRLSAFGIVGSAISILAIQLVTARQQILQAITHPIGSIAYGLGGTLLFFGISWLLLLTRSRV
jgi:Flp pilus assembly protein TadB